MKYTKKDFKHWRAYERVRVSGQFNMVTDWEDAAKTAGLSHDDYMKVIRKYSHIKSAIANEYGSIEAFLGGSV